VLVLIPFSVAVVLQGQQTSTARTSGDNSAATHLGKGYEALKQDRYQEAVKEFRAALALDASLVLRARFPMGVALFELHRLQDARRELEAVRRQAGDHPNVLYYLGRIDLEDHDYPAAILNFTKAASKPPFPDNAYYLGFACFKQGDLSSAEKYLNQAATANPRDVRIPYQLGLVYRRQGREQQAKEAFALSEKLRLSEDNESRLRVECGRKLDSGPRAEAHALCDQLYDGNNAEKLTGLGTLYAQHGDLEGSLKPLRRAAELAPQSPQVQYNLALTYFQMNRLQEARAPLANALERWPDLFPLNALYGAVLLKLGEDDIAAYSALHKAHELKPEDPETTGLLYGVLLALGKKSKNEGRYLDSLRFLEQAVELRDDDPEPHQQMADIYRLTGSPAKQKLEQQKVEQLSGRSRDQSRVQ
jgi:tetratricopeptide (TPR) repeat protein